MVFCSLIKKDNFLFFSSIEKFDLINFLEFTLYIFDCSLTNFFIYLFFVTFTIYQSLLTSRGFFKGLPGFFVFKSVAYVEESFYVFVLDILDKQIGKKGYPYFSFLLTLFFIILFSNIFGMIPFSFPIMSHIIVTFFLSLVVWLLSIWLGYRVNGLGFYKIFVPNVPKYMLPFLVILEIISYIIRVFSLAIRLAANITSGHVLMFTIANFATSLLKYN